MNAAVVTERSITKFKPNLLLLSGVAGALKDDVQLGDIVVGAQVNLYQSGKEADVFQARPKVWPASYRLLELARYLDVSDIWREKLVVDITYPSPVVHFRPIAAGETVIANRSAEAFTRLQEHYGDAAAVEMEGAGLAHAAHVNDATPALVVRGISDHASLSKSVHDADGWQPRAAAHAAAFCVAILYQLEVEDLASQSAWPVADIVPGRLDGQNKVGSAENISLERAKDLAKLASIEVRLERWRKLKELGNLHESVVIEIESKMLNEWLEERG